MPQAIKFQREHEFKYAKLERLSPLVHRVTARNPSPFTFHGTGTYIVGNLTDGGKVAVIDPGPLLDEHVDVLKRLLEPENVSHILVTHTHTDHSPACRPLKDYWGAKTFGYGPHGSGRTRPEEGAMETDCAGGSGADGLPRSSEEGGSAEQEDEADWDFVPDCRLRDGDLVRGDGWTLECIHTPGHISNHLCFSLKEEKALFSGDHVMGWSTTVIVPPDGDLADYMESLEKLLGRDENIYYPTHGPPIKEDVRGFVRSIMDHRLERERQVLECLGQGCSTIDEMVSIMYKHVDKALHGAAALSVLATITRLVRTGRVKCRDEDESCLKAKYEVALLSVEH